VTAERGQDLDAAWLQAGPARVPRHDWARPMAGFVAFLALTCITMAGLAAAAPGDKIYTMANYPVDAQAKDAVAARAKAVADGQKAALRSLLKRLVPVTQYARLRKVAVPDASRMVDSLSVRSERNSPVAYSGNLDFKFQPQAVRALLEREGFAVADKQAPQIVVVPIWRAPAAGDVPAALGPTEGPRAWSDAWKGLDLEHALAPVKLEDLKPGTHPDTLSALAKGDASFWRTFAGNYTAERLVAAIAEPDVAGRRLNVTLIGSDAVGALSWTKAYRLDLSDPAYTIELAGVVSLGVLEGRWKAITLRGAGSVAAAQSSGASSPWSSAPVNGVAGQAGGGGAPMLVTVEFRSMGEWTELSRALSNTPGVDNLDVLGLGGRSARVTLRYSDGAAQLGAELARQGYSLRNAGGSWILSGRP
jgi:hypothetical protein